jgi:hypothetical protein
MCINVPILPPNMICLQAARQSPHILSSTSLVASTPYLSLMTMGYSEEKHISPAFLRNTHSDYHWLNISYIRIFTVSKKYISTSICTYILVYIPRIPPLHLLFCISRHIKIIKIINNPMRHPRSALDSSSVVHKKKWQDWMRT